jgi:isopenicillin N synthase-like dioxygenase
MVHYAPRTDTTKNHNCKTEIFKEDGFKYTAYDHVDTGFMTMLSIFHFWGLQAKIIGERVTIPPKEDYLVVNLGYGLEKCFKGELKAVWQRVLDIDEDRHSFVFFFKIPVNHLMHENIRDKSSPSLKYEDYFIERVKKL